MIKEAEVTTPYPVQNIVLSGTKVVHDPTFSYLRNDEVTGFIPQTPGRISPNLLPYLFLSATTGSELNDIDLVAVVERNSEGMTTNYQITFEYKGWVRKWQHPESLEQLLPSGTNSISAYAKRLRVISGLTIERLAEIFGVSRTTFHKWLSGSSLHDAHREHFLEVLPLVEEALQRLGSASTVSTWLLTPVTSGGKKPIEYLSSRQYDTFRGFLLRGSIDQKLLRPPTPLNFVYRERPRQEIEDVLERLNPGLLLDEDYPDTSDRNE